MRRLIPAVVTGFMMAAFGLLCLAAAPILFAQFGIHRLRDWLETRWPESERARSVSGWLGLVALPLLCILLAVLMWMAVAWLKTKVPTRSHLAPVAQSGHDHARKD